MIGFTRPPCDAGIIRATPAAPAALSRRRKQMTLAATILGSSMAFIDGSVVNIALPGIQQALQANAASTQWIVNGYLLLLGALVLVGGSAADLYGRRRIFLVGIAIFTAASIACGLSPDITVLVVSRAVQGLGAALLIPASLAMLGATFDDHERSHAIGTWAGVGALTAAAGPVLGGWLVDQVSWRAIFLLNVPLAVAAAGLAVFFAGESRDERAKPLLFVSIEARSRERAMMPLSLYRSRNFSATNTVTLLLYFALGGVMYFLPFGLIRLGGYSATQAGAALLPFALIMGFGASFAGAVSDRFGPRLSLTTGPIIAACGLALLAFADLGKSYWVGVFPAIGVLAIGVTITVPPLTSTVMASVGEAHAGVASGVNNAVARVAGLFAVAALGALLFASFSHHLAGTPPAHANEALNAVLAGRADVTGGATAAFDRALRTVMLVTALCAALAGVAGWVWIRPIGSEATP